MTEIKLVEIHQYKKSHKYYKELDRLCWLSKNLYNATLYAVRQEYIKNKVYLNYNDINEIFTHENQVDYRRLPAKVSKHTQMLVHQSFLSFFKLLKKKENGEYDKKVSLPRYLPKDGKQVVHYEKGALSLVKDGYVKLSKTNIFIKTKIPKSKIQFSRIVHCDNYIKVEIGYKEEIITENKKSNRYASVDLGVNNLMTVTSNVFSPFIINGKPLKSINQYYNKQLAKNKSLEKDSSKLSLKRFNKINDYLHKSTAMLVDYLISQNIDTLVIGYNKNWEQEVNLGKKNNQNFVDIPFWKMINQLKYKCERNGIKFEIITEHYTSKCSFLDNEDLVKHSSYSGKRIKRGLFETSNGTTINADVNGSLNILKKYLIKKVAWNDQIWSDLVEVSSTPNVIRKNPKV